MSGPFVLVERWTSILTFLVLTASSALAQNEIVERAEKSLSISRWTLSGAAVTSALTVEPAERLRIVAQGGQSSFMVSLGKLAFRSPLTLGGNALRLGLSCNTCHPAGAVNSGFFFAAVSDRPGNLDVSHWLWNPMGDDGLVNPINIPSLRGIRWTAPYGRDGRFSSLAGFTRNVIVNEFAGLEPASLFLDALVAYQRELEFPLNSAVGADGRPIAIAPQGVQRGALLFQRDCANCHVPSSSFADGRSHDVGTGGDFDTPTLRGLSESAPYFHDGRAADLPAAVEHFDRTLNLGYDGAQRTELAMFLAALGAVNEPPVSVNVARDMALITKFGALLQVPLEDEDLQLAERITDMLRIELRGVHERFHRTTHEEQRAALVELSIHLGDVLDAAQTGEYSVALLRLSQWRKRSEAAVPILEVGAPTSLYDPDALRAAIAESD